MSAFWVWTRWQRMSGTPPPRRRWPPVRSWKSRLASPLTATRSSPPFSGPSIPARSRQSRAGPGSPRQACQHRAGHWVARFADGRRLIYRPVSVRAHASFGGVLDWLNQRVPQAGLRYAAVLPRPGYGWVEFIDHQPPTSPACRDLCYRRYGMLLAAAYALDAPGVAARDLLANGDCPVVVNAETIFRPSPPDPADPADPAAVMLAASVHRMGLLRELSQDRPVPEAAVLAGFRLGYDAITAHRGDLTRLLSRALHHQAAGADYAAGAAISKIARLSDVDRQDQEWIISATLRSRGEHRGAVPRAATATAATPLASIAADRSPAYRSVRPRRPDRSARHDRRVRTALGPGQLARPPARLRRVGSAADGRRSRQRLPWGRPLPGPARRPHRNRPVRRGRPAGAERPAIAPGDAQQSAAVAGHDRLRWIRRARRHQLRAGPDGDAAARLPAHRVGRDGCRREQDHRREPSDAARTGRRKRRLLGGDDGGA